MAVNAKVEQDVDLKAGPQVSCCKALGDAVVDDTPAVSCCKGFADDASITSTAAPDDASFVSCCKALNDSDDAPAVSCCKALNDSDNVNLSTETRAERARAAAQALLARPVWRDVRLKLSHPVYGPKFADACAASLTAGEAEVDVMMRALLVELEVELKLESGSTSTYNEDTAHGAAWPRPFAEATIREYCRFLAL